MKERLDRFDDAVRATKSAIAEGYLSGGGSALLAIRYDMAENGGSVIDSALLSPFIQICKNSGLAEEKTGAIAKELYGIKDFGYNAKTDKVENLIESGVIDPAKVVRCALQNASSAAGMILTAECVICDTFNN